MFLLWVLIVTAPLILALAPGSQPCIENSSAQITSPVLESLRCQNDYSSHIRCSWRERPQTQPHTPLSLYHLDSDLSSESLCVRDRGPPVSGPDGLLLLQCRINTLLFAIGNKDMFFFKTHHSPSVLSKTIELSQHVRVQPPYDLSVRIREGGGVTVLTWKCCSPLHSLWPSLNYQLNYRRRGEHDWTGHMCVGQEVRVETDSLVPGCWYEARVKARAEQGLWSEWSVLVEWRTKDAPVPGPSNLRCESDGERSVSCSWELSKELAQITTYTLAYRTNSTKPWTHVDPLAPLNISNLQVFRFNCSFSVNEHGQLQVELRPCPNTRVIPSYKHIHPPFPERVHIEERSRDWLLSWTPPQMRSVTISTEVRYWSADTPDDFRSFNVSAGVCSLEFPRVSLLPAARYVAQVRALVVSREGEYSYSGHPSEWTQPVTWTTKPAPRSLSSLLYAVLAVCVAVVFMVLYRSIPACQRWFRVWELSVPSPLKSKVLEEVIKTSERSQPVFYNNMDATLISEVQVLDSLQHQLYCPESSHIQKQRPEFSEGGSQPMWLAVVDSGGAYKLVTSHKEGAEIPSDASYDLSNGGVLAKMVSDLSLSEPCILCPKHSLPLNTTLGNKVHPEDSNTQHALLQHQSSSELPTGKMAPSQDALQEVLQAEAVVSHDGYSSLSLLGQSDMVAEALGISDHPPHTPYPSPHPLPPSIMSVQTQADSDYCCLPGIGEVVVLGVRKETKPIEERAYHPQTLDSGLGTEQRQMSILI